MGTVSAIAVWKPVGWTPLQAVHAFKHRYPQYSGEKISYAGRLDPMAEGVLLLLIGNENKKRKLYEQLPKTYTAQCILGITTDSLDALGIITSSRLGQINKEMIQSVLSTFIGKQSQSHPIFSSRTVGGKPLYWWARKNRISEISIPRKVIEISSITIVHTDAVSTASLYKLATEKIQKVTGDFRQAEIFKSWEDFVKKNADRNFTRVTIRVSCSSGTYIRQLDSDIGEKLGGGCFTLSITRTQVGKYTGDDCLHIV
jgi:tRNA pseudouridine55 synthase